ncbi:MAG: ribbon-helix-helix protein, CopG family [Gammaproteobacteria bacterium]
MERQLTVRLPDKLAARLDRAARRARRRRSDLVRQALEEFLNNSRAGEYVRPADLVRDLLGAIESGVPDLGQRHREHLLSRLRHAR